MWFLVGQSRLLWIGAILTIKVHAQTGDSFKSAVVAFLHLQAPLHGPPLCVLTLMPDIWMQQHIWQATAKQVSLASTVLGHSAVPAPRLGWTAGLLLRNTVKLNCKARSTLQTGFMWTWKLGKLLEFYEGLFLGWEKSMEKWASPIWVCKKYGTFQNHDPLPLSVRGQ